MKLCGQVSAFDKGLFALIVLVAGFVLNRMLESHKTKLARESEFVKLRVQAMNESWAAIYNWNNCDTRIQRLPPYVQDSDVSELHSAPVAETELLITKLRDIVKSGVWAIG